TIKNSESLGFTYAVSGNELYIYFNITSAGYYTFTMNGIFAYGVIYSFVFSQHVDTQPIVNNGLTMKVVGPSTVAMNSTYSYYIMLSLQNGNTLNRTQTISALNNLSIEYLSNGNTISTITGIILNNGTIEFSFSPTSITPDASLYITDRIGSDTASAIQPVTIISPSAALKVISIDTP
ncbi:hypothetical protein, partial [Metallibacterium scheffleri]|uniref:hypothetical protein n=1 Tax=Metallibacterium scheffleri TaxID=993689 RepID=UPI0023F0A2BA